MSVLSNLDIIKICKDLKIKNFIGVFSKDLLPKISKDGFYIINLENSKDKNGFPLPGSHYVALYLFNKDALYCDSYGIIMPKEVENFCKNRNLYYNTTEFQDYNSDCCGWFALMFCDFMNSHKNGSIDKRFNHFINHFVKKYIHNNIICQKYFQKRFKKLN